MDIIVANFFICEYDVIKSALNYKTQIFNTSDLFRSINICFKGIDISLDSIFFIYRNIDTIEVYSYDIDYFLNCIIKYNLVH